MIANGNVNNNGNNGYGNVNMGNKSTTARDRDQNNKSLYQLNNNYVTEAGTKTNNAKTFYDKLNIEMKFNQTTYLSPNTTRIATNNEETFIPKKKLTNAGKFQYFN